MKCEQVGAAPGLAGTDGPADGIITHQAITHRTHMHKQHSLIPPKNPRLGLALAACVLALAGCGGGGGSSGDDDGGGVVTPPGSVLVNPALALQGFWSGILGLPLDGATRSSAIVMPDLTAWIVFENDTGPIALAKMALTGAGVNETDATATGTGDYYRFATATRSTATATGTASTRGTFTGNINVANGSLATGFSWLSVPGFTTPATASELVGRWNGPRSDNTIPVSWVIDAAGNLSGTTLGCSYAGTMRPSNTGMAVYDLNVAEDCSAGGGAVRTLNGIGSLGTASSATPRNALRVVFTANGGANAGVFALTRQ
jgi:hypothetical protein